MKFEHIALIMEDPVKAAKWYCKNLSFTIIKSMDIPPFAHFLADSSKEILIETYHPNDKKVPDYKSMDPTLLHIAFGVENIEKEFQKLIQAGASVVSKINILATGDKVAMIRDPWGFPIQIVCRTKKIS